MNKKWTLWTLLLFLTISFLTLPTNLANADNTSSQNQAKYTIQAELPDNQINKQVSFFDLKVTPGSSQDLKFKINNTDNVDHTYLVEVNQAMTNNNGIIDYSTHGSKLDPSQKYNIESMFPKPQKIAVASNTSQEVSLHMTSPNTDFKGMILGGIRILQLGQTDNIKQDNSKKLSVNNQFAYVLGVQIQQNTDAVKPNLRLEAAHVSKFNGTPDVAAELQNDTPTIINQGEVKASVTAQGGSQKLLQIDKKDMSIAPNTHFNLPVNLSNQSLKPGKYTMRIAAKGDNGTQQWNMARNFTITKNASNKLKKAAAVTATASQPNYKLIVTLAIIAALLIIALLIWNFKLQKGRRR